MQISTEILLSNGESIVSGIDEKHVKPLEMDDTTSGKLKQLWKITLVFMGSSWQLHMLNGHGKFEAKEPWKIRKTVPPSSQPFLKGGFHTWGISYSWMVYDGKSYLSRCR